MNGCQCPKRLFLHKFRTDLRNPVNEKQESIFRSGTTVGDLARLLFPGGVDASPPDPYSYAVSVNLTNTLIAQGEEIIYEAAFQYDNVLCAVDILVKKGNVWYAFEVKSTTRVKPQHVQDAAFQYHVITNCGITLGDFSIVFLNNQYVRNGELEIQQLFTPQSVREDVIELQPFVARKIRKLKELLVLRQEPLVDIGHHCFAPYACDFTGHCWSHIPKENSVFELARGAGWKLYADGFKHLDEIPETYTLSVAAAQQLAYHRSGEVLVNHDQLRAFLKPLTYPLYFFDFETIMPAIPEFDQTRPYQQIPFQFSLHVQQSPGDTLGHHYFLGDGVNDPRPELIREMLGHLGTSGHIICYNMGFEKSRIRELAKLYSSWAPELEALHDRVVDLMIPFAKRWYYHPAFKGGYSIKTILPILAPNLSYDKLPIADGSSASLVYAHLKFQDAETQDLLKKQLLDYNALDTLAMVEILGCLHRAL